MFHLEAPSQPSVLLAVHHHQSLHVAFSDVFAKPRTLPIRSQEQPLFREAIRIAKVRGSANVSPGIGITILSVLLRHLILACELGSFMVS